MDNEANRLVGEITKSVLQLEKVLAGNPKGLALLTQITAGFTDFIRNSNERLDKMKKSVKQLEEAIRQYAVQLEGHVQQ